MTRILPALVLGLIAQAACAGEREVAALGGAAKILGVTNAPTAFKRNQLSGIELHRAKYERNRYVELTESGGIRIKGVEGGPPPKIASDEVWVRLYGPTEQSPPPCQRLTTSKSVGMPASWGDTVREDFFALVATDLGEKKSPSPFAANEATPATLRWVWGYEEYCVEVRWSVYEVKRAEQMRPFVARLAEAVHKGMVEQGLTGRAPPTFEIRVEIPKDLKPGDVLSPAAIVSDQYGKPPKDYSYNLLINGKFTRSVVWDGKETTIEVQASIVEPGHQALTKTIVIPAYGTTAPPTESTTTAVGVPPGIPGMGGIGQVPGPAGPLEGILGVAIPGLIGLIGSVIEGLVRGGAGARTPPAGLRELGQAAKDAASWGEREPGARERVPAPPVDPAAEHARKTLDRLREVAKTIRDPELATAVRMAGGAFDKDGKFDPEKWRGSQQSLKNAVEKATTTTETPRTWLQDALKATTDAPGELAVKAAEAGWNGLKGLTVGGYNGLKQIGDAVLHPGYFEQGMRERFKEWTDQHAAGEREAFLDALRKDQPLEALKALGNAGLKGVGQIGSGAWDFVKTHILPVDEAESILHPNDAEEFCWGVAAAATKVAGILTIFEPVTTTPSTTLGKALEEASRERQLVQLESQAAERVSQIERNVKSLEKAATRPDSGRGVEGALASSKKALEAAGNTKKVYEAMKEVERLTAGAMADQPPILNFPDAQRRLAQNPELRDAIDSVLRANNGKDTLFNLRANELMSKDAHTLATARKLELQQKVINNASKRIFQEEVDALGILGESIPNRMPTFNATQGSRTQISGSNINCDFDQTLLGVKHVSKDRIDQIIREECDHAIQGGISKDAVDVNVYRPKAGISDAAGASPNAPAVLENIGQTTGTSGYHPIYENPRTGALEVGDHVTAQGREGVLISRASAEPPPGMTREQWLTDYVWEGHQGKPIPIPPEICQEVLRAQVEGMLHAGDPVKIAKYANRGGAAGMRMTDEMRDLCRKVVGQKDPAIARGILSKAGIPSREEFLKRLGVRAAEGAARH